MKHLNTLPVRIYAAEPCRGSTIDDMRQAAREVWSTRGILARLWLRDLTVQYRQKLLGCAWAFLHPLLGMSSFLFLYATGMLQPGETDVPYPLYVLVGTSLWGVFLAVIQAVSGSLVLHADLVLRTGVPRITLALSGLAQALFALLMQSLILIFLVACVGGLRSWTVLSYPLLLLPLWILGLSLGLVLAILSALARDISTLVLTALGFLMYLTPVVYSRRFDQPWLQALDSWNPLSHLIDGPRQVLLTGSLPSGTGYALSAAFSLGVFLVCLRGFYLIQDLVPERI